MTVNRNKKRPVRLEIVLSAPLISLADSSGAPLAPIGADGFHAQEERKISFQRLLDSDYRGRSGWQSKEQFIVIAARVMLKNAILEMAGGGYRLAQESVENCIGLETDTSKAHFSLAELFRQRGQEADQAKAVNEYQRASDLTINLPNRTEAWVSSMSKSVDSMWRGNTLRNIANSIPAQKTALISSSIRARSKPERNVHEKKTFLASLVGA